MTRNIERTSHRTVYPAYVALKDTEVRLSDAKPVYPDVGLLLIGIESVSLFDHLQELLNDADPQLADLIEVVSTVGISPAAKVRLRTEMEHMDRLVTWLGCDVYGARDRRSIWIAETAIQLSRMADELLLEIDVGTHEEEARKFTLQRNVRRLAECWTVVRRIADADITSGAGQFPHPLASLLQQLRSAMSRCLRAIGDQYHTARDAACLGSLFNYLLADDDAIKDLLGDYAPENISEFNRFVQQLLELIGTNRHLLDDREREFFSRAASRADDHAAKAHSHQDAPTSRPLQCAVERPVQDTVPQAMPDDSAAPDWSNFHLDHDTMTVSCKAKSIHLGGRRSRQFVLLSLMCKRPGTPVSHAVLCGEGNPWQGNTANKIPKSQIKSLVRDLKRNLKELGTLPLTITTETMQGEVRPVLRRK